MPALALQQKPVAQAAPKAATIARSVVHEEEPQHDTRSLARGGTSIAAPPPNNRGTVLPFGHSIQHLPSFSPAPLSIQPKLKINQPGDKYEQEADKVADMVMRMPEPSVQRKCSCGGGGCSKCKGGHSDGEHELFQMKRVDTNSLGPEEAPPIVHEVLREPGRPLDAGTKGFMELRLGYDLGSVRLHTGARAVHSARAVGALAYTKGPDIVFGGSGPALGGGSSRHLLAHELTHVIQQGAAQPLHRTGGPDRSMGPSTIQASPMSAPSFLIQRAPGDGIKPPGDCDWSTYLPLRAAVESAKAIVNMFGGCRAGDNCYMLGAKLAAISAEIAARYVVAGKCFKGGDTGHEQQIKEKLITLSRCYAFFTTLNCPGQVREAMDTVIRRAREVVEAAAQAALVVAALIALIVAVILLFELIAAAAAGAAVAGGLAAGIALLILIKDQLSDGDDSAEA